MDAIEDWPSELRGIPAIETLASGDGTKRVRFIRRADGSIHYFFQELRRCETEGQEYFIWYSGALSGLFVDLQTAKRDAEKSIPWLRPANAD